MSNNNKLIVLMAGGLILIVTVAGVLLLMLSNANENTSNPVSNSGSSGTTSLLSSETPIESKPQSGVYKDGTYTADGSYVSPGGPENIRVSITVANDKITAVSITPTGPDPESIRYERRFASGISTVIVGKTLDQATVSGRINGSSLTGDGFNIALKSILKQAKI